MIFACVFFPASLFERAKKCLAKSFGLADQTLSIKFLLNESLKRLAKNLLELKASDTPLKIQQLPDFKHKEATSAVTFGLLS